MFRDGGPYLFAAVGRGVEVVGHDAENECPFEVDLDMIRSFAER